MNFDRRVSVAQAQALTVSLVSSRDSAPRALESSMLKEPIAARCLAVLAKDAVSTQASGATIVSGKTDFPLVGGLPITPKHAFHRRLLDNCFRKVLLHIVFSTSP